MGARRRVIRNPNVIAGLKWPPEMWPTADTMTAIAKPCASAMPTSPSPVAVSAAPCANAAAKSFVKVRVAPAPMKMSVKAPMNSAKPRRRGS